MLEKLMIGSLIVAIIGVLGFGLMDASQTVDEPVAVESAPVVAPTQVAVTQAETTPDVAVADAAEAAVEVAVQATPERVLQVAAQDTMGEAWSATGTVTLLEDFGFTLETGEGAFYVELGPPTYWQEQGIALAEGDLVQIDGHYNGEQVHASVVTVNGQQLVIRTEAGQPMWAGGVDGGQQGQGTGEANQMQVAPEDWVTLSGSLSAVSNGSITLAMADGTQLDLQLGRPDFWQSQGVTLSVGDPVEILGFWQGTQFMAGDVRKTATGETIMLRDPNGRQMWGGPGRTGESADSQGNGYRGGR